MTNYYHDREAFINELVAKVLDHVAEKFKTPRENTVLKPETEQTIRYLATVAVGRSINFGLAGYSSDSASEKKENLELTVFGGKEFILNRVENIACS